MYTGTYDLTSGEYILSKARESLINFALELDLPISHNTRKLQTERGGALPVHHHFLHHISFVAATENFSIYNFFDLGKGRKEKGPAQRPYCNDGWAGEHLLT